MLRRHSVSSDRNKAFVVCVRVCVCFFWTRALRKWNLLSVELRIFFWKIAIVLDLHLQIIAETICCNLPGSFEQFICSKRFDYGNRHQSKETHVRTYSQTKTPSPTEPCQTQAWKIQLRSNRAERRAEQNNKELIVQRPQSMVKAITDTRKMLLVSPFCPELTFIRLQNDLTRSIHGNPFVEIDLF